MCKAAAFAVSPTGVLHTQQVRLEISGGKLSLYTTQGYVMCKVSTPYIVKNTFDIDAFAPIEEWERMVPRRPRIRSEKSQVCPIPLTPFVNNPALSRSWDGVIPPLNYFMCARMHSPDVGIAPGSLKIVHDVFKAAGANTSRGIRMQVGEGRKDAIRFDSTVRLGTKKNKVEYGQLDITVVVMPCRL